MTGDLSDTRTRYLGSRPVKLFRITMQGSEAVSACFLLSIQGILFICFESSLKLKYNKGDYDDVLMTA